MITSYVTENNTAVAKPFPGMSLAEACVQLTYETSQIMNDLNMSILLKEHAYLYENGVEIQYVDEAGKDNANGVGLREKAKAALITIGNKIQELFDKLLDFIYERKNAIVDYFNKIGVNKKDFDKYRDSFLATSAANGGRTMKFAQYVNFDKFTKSAPNERYKAIFDDYGMDGTASNTIFDDYVEKDKTITLDTNTIDDAMDFVYYGTSVINDVRKEKKAANDAIKKLMNTINKASLQGDEFISNMNKTIKVNNAVARDVVKIYHMHMKNCADIVRTVIRDKAARNDANAKAKEAKKNDKDSKNKKDTPVKESAKFFRV